MRLLPFAVLVGAATVVLRLWLLPSGPPPSAAPPVAQPQTGLAASPDLPQTLPRVALPPSPSVHSGPHSVLSDLQEGLGRPSPPPPLFLLDEGGKADSVVTLPPSAATPFALAAARYGLPLVPLEVVMAGAGHGERVTPAAWSVDADGRIRQTTREAAGLLTGFALLLAALLGGTLIDGMARRAESPANWPGGLAVAGIVAGCGQALGADAGPLGGDLMPLLAVGAAWLPGRDRAALLLAALAACGLVGAATTEIVAPHPALAGLYGPLGLMGWDIVWSVVIAVGGLAAAVLVRGRTPVGR